MFALAAKRKGFEVLVFEKDVSAIRGEGQYRGPIQIQSNALAALEAIDMDVAEEVMKAGCITGDRINGLVDGISGSWCFLFFPFLIPSLICANFTNYQVVITYRPQLSWLIFVVLVQFAKIQVRQIRYVYPCSRTRASSYQSHQSNDFATNISPRSW